MYLSVVGTLGSLTSGVCSKWHHKHHYVCWFCFIASVLLGVNCTVAMTTPMASGPNAKFMSGKCGISFSSENTWRFVLSISGWRGGMEIELKMKT